MHKKSFKNAKEEFKAANYCLAFLDLLGQRDALREHGILPVFRTEEDQQQFLKSIKTSVGAIYTLQDDAEKMLHAMRPRKSSHFRARLPKDQRSRWDNLQRAPITYQRWSDGLVAFVSLEQRHESARLNRVFNLLVFCGAMCFFGLARGQPLRGAIEVAWGVELRPHEIYGPAVARAYELESCVAQHPRIVVGPNLIKMLHFFVESDAADIVGRVDRETAKICLQIIEQDFDGVDKVHYLGAAFCSMIYDDKHHELFKKAYQFIEKQLLQHRNSGNSKLAIRYSNLQRYFDLNAPDN